jgi:hypothetical protein
MNQSTQAPQRDDNGIELSELVGHLRRSFRLIFGTGMLGLACGVASYVLGGGLLNVNTTTRVVFSFPGFEKGLYPDGSRFQPEDLRSPEIVAEALKRKGIQSTADLQGRVRSALSIEGIIPESIIRERDKLRATGQAIRPYVPDEYLVILSLPRRFPLPVSQREMLLDEIVSVYQEQFVRTYVAVPLNFGKAFETLNGADYFDYDLVLKRENDNIESFLTQMATNARSYRSPRTNLSFSDLLKESELFAEIRMNEVLGLIRREGLSRDRKVAMIKMDYYLKTLNDEESKAVEDEKVVRELLKQAQDREQNYAIGIKTQATQSRTESMVVDQGLVDSLLANDSYNFLVRKALDASLNTRRIQANKAVLEERRTSMESFLKSDITDKAESLGQFQKSYEELHRSYDSLMKEIRLTYEDYQRQQFGDAIRVSMQAKTLNIYVGIALAALVGATTGLIGGLGFALVKLGTADTRRA